jgi:type I restriction enzyme, S subunit
MIFYGETLFQDFTIGRIAKDWNVESLQDILVLLKNGLTVKQTREGNGYPITRIETISKERIDPNRVGYSKQINEKDIEAYKLKKGDILFSHINSLEHIGKTALYEGVPESLLHGMNLLLLRPKKAKINPNFLLYMLKLLRTRNVFWAMSNAAVNQASINQTELGKLKIPVPSTAEQDSMVEILGVVYSALELADQVIAKTERLKKGLMQQLLTHGIGHTEYKQTPIGKIPKEWEVTTIDKECSVGTGGTPARNTVEYYGGEISWVKSTEVNYGIITKTEETITEEGVQYSNAKVYPAGALVMALYGQGTTRGKCAILGIDAAVNQACAVLQSKGQIHIPYLFYWCQNSYSAIRGLSQGANQANLNMGIIRSLYIPLPPIAEQKKITEILSIIDNKLNIEESEKAKTERIKQGLMDLLLTGKVRIKVD